jgi:hypothetical protein
MEKRYSRTGSLPSAASRSSNPKPQTLKSPHQTPEPLNPNPKPLNPNPKPLNPQPKTLTPHPSTQTQVLATQEITVSQMFDGIPVAVTMYSPRPLTHTTSTHTYHIHDRSGHDVYLLG